MDLYPEAPEVTSFDKTNTKERIMSSAIRLFSRYGYEGTSVRMLCNESDVNISSISFYFGSKDNLYHDCLQYIADLADSYYDPAYKIAKKALEKDSLTKEEAYEAALKIVDAQITSSLAPHYQSSLRLINWEQNSPQFDFHPISDTLFEKCEKPLAELIAAVTPLDYSKSIIASRFLNGSIISFGEHSLLVQKAIEDSSADSVDATSVQKAVREYATTLLKDMFELKS